MKHWAQFYERRTNGDVSGYVEAIADRSIVFLDGRWSRRHMGVVAASVCKKRGYDGWRLVRGENLLVPHYLNDIQPRVVEIATDEDRKLADYIRRVRKEIFIHGGNGDRFYACMASILVEYRNGMSPETLGKQIAEHG